MTHAEHTRRRELFREAQAEREAADRMGLLLDIEDTPVVHVRTCFECGKTDACVNMHADGHFHSDCLSRWRNGNPHKRAARLAKAGQLVLVLLRQHVPADQLAQAPVDSEVWMAAAKLAQVNLPSAAMCAMVVERLRQIALCAKS